MSTATQPDSSTAPFGWLRRTEDWLNERGSAAWIGSFVLGFIFFWPLGMIILFYWLFFRRKPGRRIKVDLDIAPSSTTAPSSNSAFETYKQETIARLSDEQTQFEEFLERLRAARDKQEFDAFLDEQIENARIVNTIDDDQA